MIPGPDPIAVPSPAVTARKPGPWLRALGRGCLAGFLLAVGGNVLYTMVGSNFHTVLHGQVYRCAQASGPGLEKQIHRHQIRTVLNLRGCCDIFPWYIEECRATHHCNVSQEDISLSAGRLPAAHELRRLVEVLDHSERPILIHCRRGADRTGLASAFVLLLDTDASVAQARRQLGLRYGHVALGKTAYLDRFLDLYEEWLGDQSLAHSPAVFRRWVREGYCPDLCRCRVELREPLATVPAHLPYGVPVRMHNTSIRTWQLRRGTNAGVHAAFMIYNAEGRSAGSGRAGLFDAEVAPGDSIDLTVVLPPLEPGRYRLVVDMVDELHCWFFQTGSEPLEQEIEVREQEAASGSRDRPAGLAGLAD